MAEPLSQEDERCLRAFQRQVDRLRNSSIVQQGKLQLSFTTKIEFPTGRATTSFQGYEPELFQSQLPILRQFMLNDAVSFNHVHNIINRCCDRQELLDWTRLARRKWHERLTSLSGEVHRHFHQPELSVEEAIEKLFYGFGGLFHVNIDDPEEEASVSAIQEGTLHHAFPYLCWSLNVLDSVIHWWLDATGDTVPPIPAE